MTILTHITPNIIRINICKTVTQRFKNIISSILASNLSPFTRIYLACCWLLNKLRLITYADAYIYNIY